MHRQALELNQSEHERKISQTALIPNKAEDGEEEDDDEGDEKKNPAEDSSQPRRNIMSLLIMLLFVVLRAKVSLRTRHGCVKENLQIPTSHHRHRFQMKLRVR